MIFYLKPYTTYFKLHLFVAQTTDLTLTSTFQGNVSAPMK